VWPDLSVEARPRINNGYRRIGDRSSWVISLDTSDVRLAPVPDSLVQFSQFEVATEPEPLFQQGRSARQGSPQIRVRELATAALRHGFTFASDSWHQFVTERAQRWIWPELLKLEAEERPKQLRNGMPNHHDIFLPSDFRLPESWHWADDQVRQWYDEWERTASKETGVSGSNQGRRQGRRY